MCGITGAFASRDVGDVVRRMTDALRHRGPDDAGLASASGVLGATCGSLGHRRLSILDLSSAGHQPMSTLDGRYTLVFNGEIYNYRQLRAELEADGDEFQSGTDTEVLLLGWARYGADFLGRLRGMFAFGMWDSVSRVGTLVRDPFGIKPLYIAEVDGVVLFGSEVRALLASDLVPRTICPEAVRSYLVTGSVIDPLTIIDGIQSLPAGTLVEVRVDDSRACLGPTTPYVDSPLPVDGKALESPREAAARVRAALRDSVAHHLVSDVPVGFFLSGGIDSSALVGVASELSSMVPNTFTVTFSEEEFSEAIPARAVAQRFGTEHREIHLSGEDLLAALPDAFSAMDQPSIDGLNTYVVSRAVREQGIKVVLSGLGGDELFGGYPSFRRAALIRSLWSGIDPVRRVAMGTARRLAGVRGQKLSLVLGGSTPAQAAYLASRALFSGDQVNGLVGEQRDEPAAEAAPALSLLQQVSWYETTGYMRNTLLRDSDVFSMAHGLELRVPYVDREVAAAAMQVSDAQKLRRGAIKPVLVAAVEDLLPTSVWDRPKQGFTLPFDRWMRRELRAEVASMFQPQTLKNVGLSSDSAAKVWGDFLQRRNGVSWSRAWALYTLLRWARDNGCAVGPTSAQPLRAVAAA